MGKSFDPQADRLSLHRDRHGAPECNVALVVRGKRPAIEVRTEASMRVCAVDPLELDH